MNYLDLRRSDNYSGIFGHESPETENSKYCYDDLIIVMICLSGKARFCLGGKEYDVTGNSFLCIASGEPFHFRDRSGDFDADIIIFTDYILKKTAQGLISIYFSKILREHPLQHIPEHKTSMCHHIFGYLKQLIEDSDNFFQRQIIKDYLEILFYEGCNIMLHDSKNGIDEKQRHESKKNKITGDFLNLAEKEIKNSRKVEYYALKLRMSAKYMSSVVKEVTGKTPTEWINEYTLTESKIMLKNSENSIQSISYDLGFATPSHFGKFFKERTGMTPKEFRKAGRYPAPDDRNQNLAVADADSDAASAKFSPDPA